MSMSKKDFIALADAIKAHNASNIHFPHDQFADKHVLMLARFCAMQNPNFMKDRWLSYLAGTCGKNGGAVK